MFLKWKMITSKAMHCVGDKESGEMDNEVVSSCSWVDKQLRSMNDIDLACKWVAILLCVQL